jgi:hypothetical protein
MSQESKAPLFKKGNQLLLSIDTQDMPGRVKVVTVEFHTHYMPAKRFEETRFELLDPTHPHAGLIRKVLS